MKLEKNIGINSYEVVAKYKKKTKKSPLIAILQLAREEDDTLYSEVLYDKLLKPLTIVACKNLLDRLSNMGYFEKREKDSFIRLEDEEDFVENDEVVYEYELTDLGIQSADDNEIYEEKQGVLEVYIADSEFVKQKVVKIVEKNQKADSHKDSYYKEFNSSQLREIRNNGNKLILNSGEFVINSLEKKVRELKKSSEILTINGGVKDSIVKVLSFEDIIPEKSEEIREIVLSNCYNEDYLKREKILLVDFNIKKLALQRHPNIEKPLFRNTRFNNVKVNSVNLSPRNIYEAAEWLCELVIVDGIKENHFIEEGDFEKRANDFSDKFHLYKDDLKDGITKKEMIEKIDEVKHFYKKSKLQTINYLNY